MNEIDARDAANRLIVALDVPTVAEARALVARLGGAVTFYKVGMWLLYARETAAFVDDLIAAGKNVFLDCKMFDIPETVRHGVASVARRGCRIVTVHGDPDMVAAAAEGAKGTDLMVFAVTVLTSQDDAALQAMGYDRSVAELVGKRAHAAAKAGAAGVIASASDDLAPLKTLGLKIATPGIRLPGGDAQDQKRIATPGAAIARGADYLVVGRPITQAPDPVAAAHEVLSRIRQSINQPAAPA